VPRRKDTQTVQLGLRVKEWMRAALEESARERGVSMNAEIVRRLEQTFHLDEQIETAFGDATTYEMMRAVAAAMRAAGGRARWLEGHPVTYPWTASAYAYQESVQAAIGVLDALRPPGEVSPPAPQPKPAPRKIDLARSGLGNLIAEDIVSTLRDEDPPDELEEARRALRRVADRLRREEQNQ
jgi:Arc-like DNA binding domain